MTQPRQIDRPFGSERFIARSRNPKLRPPVRWEPLPEIEGVKKL